MTPMPGTPFPLGATVRDGGTNFAVTAADADGMTLCLFDGDGTQTQVPLSDFDAGVWHGFLPGVGAGQAYGYRAAGRYDPGAGLRFNPAKLLLDPCARAVHGAVRFGPEVLGPTDDEAVLALRQRQSRAMLTTLLLSFGIPMLLGGDEIGRSQQGNNNAYCQDNEITWYDWPAADQELLAFTRQLLTFRQAHPAFRRRRFLGGADAGDLGWYTPAGTAMTAADWADRGARALAIYLDGSDAPDRATDGSPLLDDDFLVLVSAWWEPLGFTIPAIRAGQAWRAEIDSYDPARPATAAMLGEGDQLTVNPRSIVVLRSEGRQKPHVIR